MWNEISLLKSRGYTPKTVIDVGAHGGDWTRNVARIFPDSMFYMIEPDPSMATLLQTLEGDLEGRGRYIKALLGSQPSPSVPFYLMGAGSSVLPELTSFPRQTIHLQGSTLDELLAAAVIVPPVFMNLDVQGYELEVLAGGTALLRSVNVIIAEVSLLEYNQGSPLFADVVDWMNTRDFVVHDFCSGLRRQSDGALFQVDVMFVNKYDDLRKHSRFWLSEP